MAPLTTPVYLNEVSFPEYISSNANPLLNRPTSVTLLLSVAVTADVAVVFAVVGIEPLEPVESFSVSLLRFVLTFFTGCVSSLPVG